MMNSNQNTEMSESVIDSIRHAPNSMTPILICRQLLRFASTKSEGVCYDKAIEQILSLCRDEGLIDTLPKEILSTLKSHEMEAMLNSHFEVDMSVVFTFLRHLCTNESQGVTYLATELFGKAWKYSSFFQVKLIAYALASDMYWQILYNCPGHPLARRIPNLDQLKAIPDDLDVQIRPWMLHSLYELLLQLSENQANTLALEELFFVPFNKCPDLLILGLMEFDKPDRFKDVVLKKTFRRFINTAQAHPNHAQVLARVWPADMASNGQLTPNQRVFLLSMVEIYNYASADEKGAKLSRILDIAQEYKVLNYLLSTNSCEFALELACLASRREYLKLEKYITDQILQPNHQQAKSFATGCIEFVRKRCPLFASQMSSSIQFSNETFGIILQALRQTFEDPKTLIEQEILTTMNMFVQRATANQQSNMPFMGRMNMEHGPVPVPMGNNDTDTYASNMKMAVSASSTTNVEMYAEFSYFNIEYSKDIEDESDSYFQKIYNQDQADSMSVDHVLETLKKFYESPNMKERHIYMCMVRNLYKEFPYLEQYPDKELITTGELFGGLILWDFVKGNVFVHALRVVLDSLKRNNTKYFMFGQAALNKFKTRLREFPQYCSHLASLPHVRDLATPLLEYIQYGKDSLHPPNQVQPAGAARKTSSQVTTASTNAAAANEDFAVHVELVAPTHIVQERLSFLVNNLSHNTIDKKVKDIRELIGNNVYWPWVAQYFVQKRVGLEANYHEIYAKFIRSFSVKDADEGQPDFYKLILSETYRSIRTILRSNKEQDSFSDRTLLKNLGQWLGMITLRNNIPILGIELDPKNLIVEAYHKGELQLTYVVPFIAKIITGITKECVFALPNPWTMSILYVLTELHSIPDLKLNLKFEVEVLCKHMDIVLADYRHPVSILKNMEYFMKIEHQLGSSAQVPQTEEIPAQNVAAARTIPTAAAAAAAAAAASSTAQAAILQQQQQQQQQPFANVASTPQNSRYAEIDASSLASLSNVLVFKRYPVIEMNHGVENYIKTIIEKSVLDWAHHIAERVVSIPLGTIDIILKRNFQSIGEMNPEYLRIAGEHCIRFMVGGFALVHTKEQLLTRMMTLLSQLFQKTFKLSKDIADVSASNIANDNIDVCVCFIEKFCIDRGIEDWNKKCRIDFANVDFEALKSKPRAVTAKQMQFFEEIAKSVSNMASALTVMAPSAQQQAPQIIENRMKPSLVEQQFPQELAQQNPDIRLMPLFDKMASNLVDIIKEFENYRIPTDHLSVVLEHLRMFKQKPREQSICAATIRAIVMSCRQLTLFPDVEVSAIYRCREFYAMIFKMLTEARVVPGLVLVNAISRCFMEFWCSKEVNFPDPLFEFFYKMNFINLIQVDQDFTSVLENGNEPNAVLTVLNFLKHYLTESTLDLPMREFHGCYNTVKEIIIKIRKNNSNHVYLPDLMTICAAFSRFEPRQEVPAVSHSEIIEKGTYIVREWIAHFNLGKMASATDFTETAKNLSAAGFLKTEDTVCTFFRIFLEYVVDKSNQLFKAVSQKPKVQMVEVHLKMFEFIDPFSSLAITFIKESGKSGNYEQKMSLFVKIIAIIAETALREEKVKDVDFNPIPYYRIIFYLFSEMLVPSNFCGNDTNLTAEMQHMFMENIAANVTTRFVNLMRSISPNALPSFTFAWIDLISHKTIMNKFLGNSARLNSKTWGLYFSLILELLSFLKSYWNIWNIQQDELSSQLYAAHLKIFNLIRNDYPDFFCEFGFSIVQHIPFVPYLMQTRNIILSAIPSNMNRVDLYSQIETLSMADLNEMAQNQRNPQLNTAFHQTRMKGEVDNALSGNLPPKNVISELMLSMAQRNEKGAVLNNSQLIFGLLLNIGQHAVQHMKIFNPDTVRQLPYYEFFVELIPQVDVQSRYMIFVWMIDHIRYPCKDTLFYMSIIMAIFKDIEEYREMIARSLLERQLSHPPQCWGQQYVTAELTKSGLLDEEFIKSIPSVETNIRSPNPEGASTQGSVVGFAVGE